MMSKIIMLPRGLSKNALEYSLIDFLLYYLNECKIVSPSFSYICQTIKCIRAVIITY